MGTSGNFHSSCYTTKSLTSRTPSLKHERQCEDSDVTDKPAAVFVDNRITAASITCVFLSSLNVQLSAGAATPAIRCSPVK